MFFGIEFCSSVYKSTLEKISSAVRETGTSRHHGSLIEGPPQTPRHYSALMNQMLQEGPQPRHYDAERR